MWSFGLVQEALAVYWTTILKGFTYLYTKADLEIEFVMLGSSFMNFQLVNLSVKDTLQNIKLQ